MTLKVRNRVTLTILLLAVAGSPAMAEEARATLRLDAGAGEAREEAVERVVVPPPYFDPEAFQRVPPADRFTFRGEHAGIIYTPSGWRALDVDPSLIGPGFFSPYGPHAGYSAFVPGVVGAVDRSAENVGLGASYEIVTPGADRFPPGPPFAARPAGPAEGHYELRAEEVPVPGEYVEVYHPPVYVADEEGNLQLVEAEETTRVPKVKIVMRRVWVEGGPEPRR